MDPSSKSPDVEINCKEEDRKGGAGRGGAGQGWDLVQIRGSGSGPAAGPALSVVSVVTTPGYKRAPGDRGASAAFHWE